MATKLSTGLTGHDTVIDYLREGDNVVWQVDSIADLRPFIAAYVERARQDGRKIVYVRFADHEPLVSADGGITTHSLNAYAGFETFSTQVHRIISDHGRGAYYVFDCLSDLLSAWASDLMIGNFFGITCPYLYELDTIAYFGLLRNSHSYKTIARIRETTQLLLDLYNFKGSIYVHPLKVFRRYAPTMFLPHLKQGDRFLPITSSVNATKLISHISESGRESMAAQARSLGPTPVPASRGVEPGRVRFRPRQGADRRALVPHHDRARGADPVAGPEILHARRPARDQEPDDRNRDHRLARRRDFCSPRKILTTDPVFPKADTWSRTTRSMSAPTSSTPTSSRTAGGSGAWPRRPGRATIEVAAELKEKMLTGKFPEQIRDEFQRCSSTLASLPSSFVRAACTKTRSGTRSRKSTRVSSASIRVIPNNVWRVSRIFVRASIRAR
jgi:hypothetical protein